jgi:hypothetical protein
MEKVDLLKLYEIAVEEELRWTSSHQERVNFYSSIFTAIVAGLIAGSFQANQAYHFFALGVGAIVLFVISRSAPQGTFREYQRLLEAITFRAKIEQELGLTQPLPQNMDTTNRYWSSEPMVAPRHITSRNAYVSSADFIKENVTKGYQGIAIHLFQKFQWLSVLLSILFFSLALWMVFF